MASTYLRSDSKLHLREDSGSQKKRTGENVPQHFILYVLLSTEHARTWVRGIDYVHGLSQIRHPSAAKATEIGSRHSKSQDGVKDLAYRGSPRDRYFGPKKAQQVSLASLPKKVVFRKQSEAE